MSNAKTDGSSGDWIDQEFAGRKFKDERSARRFRAMLSQLSSAPGQSIPLVCQDWANTKAAYRFLDNARVDETDILAGHLRSTRERFALSDAPVLVLHDLHSAHCLTHFRVITAGDCGFEATSAS